MPYLHKALMFGAASLFTTQVAMADQGNPPWPSANDIASASALIGDSTYDSQVLLDGSFNYEHTFPDTQSTDRVYSKINVNNEGGPGSGSPGYYTNFYGYYETYGTASTYDCIWDISGTYDFAGTQDKFLQFGVNTNPDRPLDVPENGLITFILWINGQEIITPGYPHNPGWKFAHGMSGANLWYDTQQQLGETGTWRLEIIFNGMTDGDSHPQSADQRFDAWLGVVDSLDIPAPGVLALLGIGGIGMRRRRS